jgi:hypothetical protein
MTVITRTLFKMVSPQTQNELTAKRRFALWRANGRLDLNDLMKLALDASPYYSDIAIDHLVARDHLHDNAILKLSRALVDVKRKEHSLWHEEVDLGRGPMLVEYFGRYYPRRDRAQEILRKLHAVSSGERKDRIAQLLKEAPPIKHGQRVIS